MNTISNEPGTPPPPKPHTYAAALVLIGCLFPLPIVMMIVTASIYIAPFSPALTTVLTQWIPLGWAALLAGFIISLILWLLFALPFTSFSSVESAIPVSGSHLKNHFLALCAGFNALLDMENTGNPIPKEHSYSYHMASEQVRSYLAEIAQALSYRDMRWIAGTGYLHAWNLVHRAEEAMITIEPREEVIREAIYDELCLTGSSIEARSLALNKLRTAISNLSASAMIYLDAPSSFQSNAPVTSQPNSANSNGTLQTATVNAADQSAMATSTATPQSSATMAGETTVGDGNAAKTALINGTPAGDPGSETMKGSAAQEPVTPVVDTTATGKDQRSTMTELAGGTDSMTEPEARGALRDVRRTINEFRDGLWEGLVTLRNQLLGTALIAGTSTYVLLGFAIIAGASPTSIKGAMTFYLVGALVGLFGCLYAESQSQKANDDYDLTLARIIATPILGGLAAVGGVLLMAMLSLTLLKTPGAPPQSVQIVGIYNLGSNELGVVIAAVFGYSPNLFINVLRDKAANITSQLQNISASDQGTKV